MNENAARTPQTNLEGDGQVMMSSLRNKNKKKGFKQSLGGPIPAKIVFDLDDAPESNARVRLVPPSEIQEQGNLPANMFVTSVDVEKGMWDRKKKGKRKEQALYGEWAGSQGRYENVDMREEDAGDDVDMLQYGDAEKDQVAPQSQADVLDWDLAEKVWEKSLEVQNVGQLGVGQVVGWKVILSIDIFLKTGYICFCRVLRSIRKHTLLNFYFS